jgi:hypothetical protein
LPRDHISITAEGFAAIKATRPKGSKAEARPDGKGGYLIALPHGGRRPHEGHAQARQELQPSHLEARRIGDERCE